MALKVRDLSDDERTALEQVVRSRTSEVRLKERAEIILAASRGQRVPAIARELRLAEKTVRLWLKRLNERGLEGLKDQPRSGRPATYNQYLRKETALVHNCPKNPCQEGTKCTKATIRIPSS